MACLVDTHIALWFIAASERLPKAAHELLRSQRGPCYVSIVSAWEVMLKHQSRPDQMIIDAGTFVRDCEESGFTLLGLKPEHVNMAATLPAMARHKDHFDRMLLAQAQAENLSFITHDRAFEAYESPNIMLV